MYIKLTLTLVCWALRSRLFKLLPSIATSFHVLHNNQLRCSNKLWRHDVIMNSCYTIRLILLRFPDVWNCLMPLISHGRFWYLNEYLLFKKNKKIQSWAALNRAQAYCLIKTGFTWFILIQIDIWSGFAIIIFIFIVEGILRILISL